MNRCDAYYANNPVMYLDISGQSWESFWNSIGKWITKTFGISINKEASKFDFTNYFGVCEIITGSGNKTSSGKPIDITINRPIKLWKFWEYSIGIEINMGDKSVGTYIGGESGISYKNKYQAFDVSANSLMRIGFKFTEFDQYGNYTYSKYDINSIEIIALVAVAVYAPALLIPFALSLS